MLAKTKIPVLVRNQMFYWITRKSLHTQLCALPQQASGVGCCSEVLIGCDPILLHLMTYKNITHQNVTYLMFCVCVCVCVCAQTYSFQIQEKMTKHGGVSFLLLFQCVLSSFQHNVIHIPLLIKLIVVRF
jgi:hypothetical protein